MVIGQEMDDLDRAFDSSVEPIQYAGDGSAGTDLVPITSQSQRSESGNSE